MMTKQRLPLLAIATLLFGVIVPAAVAAPPAPAPSKTMGQKAGSITALLPIAHIERGVGRSRVTTDAKKGDEIIWNDLIKTERGGRARITLTDQSILSLGSQADLRVVKHDARSQQTALQMTYGRVRAEVAKVTRQGGSFELRTPTAVAGVIGTDFGAEAGQTGDTTFVCISGLVQVSNIDPNIAGSVQCAPGMTTSVTAGKAPTPPTNATPAQIQQLIQDTEPAIIMAMAPLSSLPGATIDATLTGTKMGNIKTASISGTGITIQLNGVTDTTATVHMVIAPTAAPGPRTIHLGKPSGADSAAVFTILAPPNAAQGGDFQKAYLDLITQEGQTTVGGLSAYLATLQQEAGQAIQQLQQANTVNLNLNDASNQFNAEVAAVQTAINAATQQINQAMTLASTNFTTQYQAAYQALLQRNPNGTPDDQFNQAVKTAFDTANAGMAAAFTTVRNNLLSLVATANTNIAQAQQTWMTTIASASARPCDPGQICPAVNSAERSVDVGAALGGGGLAALDASNSKASSGGSIISYHWVLCDPSYKPAQTGVPLAANATAGCNAVAGYASSSSDFQFPTCNLQPNDYVARVTVADSNNKSAAMDVKLHILAGGYDDPSTVVRNLAQAYGTLQITSFLNFFDETGFSGFTQLSENIRNTFPSLASMSINPRVSQAAITCNDATVRADWVQNYTYKTSPNVAFSQEEQLSIRMARTPGKGWLITDFQGDNGTVQGQLPGPVVTDAAVANLTVTAVYPTYVGQASLDPPVPPGTQSFTAVIQNIGNADFSGSATVDFVLLDTTGATLASTNVSLTFPAASTSLPSGQSTTITASLAVPTTIGLGAKFNVAANANPTKVGAESRYDDNSNSEELILGTPVTLTQVSALTLQTNDPTATAPVTGTVQVQVSAASDVTISLPAGIFLVSAPGNTATQTATGAQTITWQVYATTAALAGTNLQNITVTANGGIPVTLAYAYNLTGIPNYVITSVGFSGHTAPYTGAQALQVGDPNTSVVVVVQNTGNGTATGNVTLTATCVALNTADTTSCSGGNNPTGTFAAPAAGQSITANLQLGGNNGMIPGHFTGTVALTTAITQSNTSDDSLTIPFDTADFVVTVQAPISPQYILPGSSQNFTVAVQVLGTTPFAVPVTLSLATGSGVTFSPGTAPVSGAQVFSVVADTTAPTGGVGVIATGVNRGVSRPAAQAFVVVSPVIVATNVFVNDASNPLLVTVGSTTPQQVGLQISGSAFTGAATIVLPTLTGFSINTDATAGAPYNTPFNLNITATAASTAAVPLIVTAQLPNTNPVLSISKTIYVQGSGQPDLAVISATPTTTISSSTPWIDGEGVDYSVQVQNVGNAPSAGGEKVTVELNGVPVGSGQLSTTPLAAGATQTITVHAVAPDIHGNTAFGPTTVNGRVHIEPMNDVNAGGEMSYANNSLAISPTMANWHIATSGVGSESTPLQITTSTNGGSAIAIFTGVVDGGSLSSYSSLSFAPGVGQASASFQLSNFGNDSTTCGTTPPTNTMFCATISTASSSLQPGVYFAQALVTLTDSVTGQRTVRQATVAVQVNTGSASAVPCLTSSANNISSQNTACGTSTPTTLEINGGLPEQFSVTMNMICGLPTAAFACSGSADFAIQDAANTTTTSLASTSGVPSGQPVVLRVGAIMDANGNVSVGSQPYTIGVNGIQVAAATKNGSAAAPDPIGNKVSLAVQVGDLGISATNVATSNGAFCGGVVPGGPGLSVGISFNPVGGFNASYQWAWEDTNHGPVGSGPFSFSTSGGSGSPSSAGTTITLSTPSNGLTRYFLAVTISTPTSTATATKYFPFFFDGSTAQNYCGAISGARGRSSITGTWSRSAADSLGPITGVALSTAEQKGTGATAGTTDIHLVASDISFSPSIPKPGDTVHVRFGARNDGTANAVGVPIALQVNGATVAIDTFDVAAGHSTLGGLSWTVPSNTADAEPATMVRPRRPGRISDPDATPMRAALSGLTQLQAALVVDPNHVTQQATTLDKTVAITRLNVNNATTQTASAGTAPGQRVLIELEDGACAGLRLSSGGMSPCGTADLEITVADLAKSALGLDTMAGVSDVGTAFEATAGRAASYNQQAAGFAGHVYSVRLANGGTATVTIESVRNPAELDAKARALFRASAARIFVGSSAGAAAPGDLTGVDNRASMFITLNVRQN